MADQKYPEYQGPTGEERGHRHETSGVKIKYLAYFAVGLLISAVVIHVVLAGMFFLLDAMRRDTAGTPVVGGPMPPPAPRLQVSPSMDLDVFRAEIEAVLNSYGWVDQELGVARIPVEKAMDLIGERGLPTSPGDLTYESSVPEYTASESGIQPRVLPEATSEPRPVPGGPQRQQGDQHER